MDEAAFQKLQRLRAMRVKAYLDSNFKDNHVGSGVWDVSDCEIMEFSGNTPLINEENLQQYTEDIKDRVLRYARRDDKPNEEKIAEEVRKRVSQDMAESDKIKAFIEAHKETLHYASAYDVHQMFLLSKEPASYEGGIIGDGFEGHGTAAVLLDCPKKLMILGQND